jgi:hypothetical protein
LVQSRDRNGQGLVDKRRVSQGKPFVVNRTLGADGDAMAAGKANLVCAGAKNGETLPILLKKPCRTYFAAHAVTQTSVVIDSYQAHVFLL